MAEKNASAKNTGPVVATPADDADDQQQAAYLDRAHDDDNDNFSEAGLFDDRVEAAADPEEAGGDIPPDDDADDPDADPQEPAQAEADEADPEPAEAAEGKETPPAEEPPADPTPAAAEPATPAPPEPAAQPVEEPPATVEAQPTQEEINARYAQWRGDAEKALETHYQLTPEQVEAFEEDPGKTLAQLASRMHMEVLTTSVAYIAQMIPSLVSQTQRASSQNAEAEKAFYEKWPDLKGQDKLVGQLAYAYRQVNPQATQEDLINTVGVQAMVQLRKPIPGYSPQAAPVEPAKPRPPAPAAARGGAPAMPQPAKAQQSEFGDGVFIRTEDLADIE